MREEQFYEEKILNQYLLEMELTEGDIIRDFLHKNELTILISTLLNSFTEFFFYHI